MFKTVLAASAIVATSAETIQLGKGDHDFFHGEFSTFIRKYGKAYETHEVAGRFAQFIENWKFIEDHNNNGGHSYKVAMNEYGDLSKSEFKERFFGFKGPSNDFARGQNAYKKPEGQVNADAVDWRTKNAVTPIKNQGQCGSCWAFSTTGSTEGANAIKSGKLVSLSEQQLVDCSKDEGNMGCNGGLMDQGFEYIIKNGGIGSEAAYPYTAHDGTCKKTPSVATVSSYKDCPKGDEKSLVDMINNGPVSIAIEADHSGFQFYTSGVFDSMLCGKQLDHGVLIVGYDTDSKSGKPYYIVKNSWGETWGNKGYIWLVRDKDMCGLADAASQPSA